MSLKTLSQRIERLVLNQSTTKLKKAPRPTKRQLQQWQIENPDSLQVKLAMSPFAAILASPIRYCTFHRKRYPSDLLVRFGLGLDPKTLKPTAYPAPHDDGHGYYVKLNRKVLDHIQHKEYKRLFRGEVVYSKSMSQQVERVMIQDLIKQAHTIPWIPLKYQDEEWTTMDGLPIDPSGYQCILSSNPPTSINTTTTTTTTDPLKLYDVRLEPWQPLYQILPTDSTCMGLPKSMDTVSFAVALYRYHLWVQSCLNK